MIKKIIIFSFFLTVNEKEKGEEEKSSDSIDCSRLKIPKKIHLHWHLYWKNFLYPFISNTGYFYWSCVLCVFGCINNEYFFCILLILEIKFWIQKQIFHKSDYHSYQSIMYLRFGVSLALWLVWVVFWQSFSDEKTTSNQVSHSLMKWKQKECSQNDLNIKMKTTTTRTN